MDKKQWYIVRKKGEKQWTAYNVTKDVADSLKKGYEKHGPYNSFIAAWIASSRIKEEKMKGTKTHDNKTTD